MVSLATDNDMNIGAIREALLADPKERLKILKANTDNADALLEMVPLMQQMDSLRTKAGAAITESKTNYKATISTAAEASATAQAELLDTTIKTLSESHFLLRDSAKNPKWLEGIKVAATALISGTAKPEDIASAALRAQVADHYLVRLVKTDTELRAAQNQIDKLRGVRPRNDAKSATPTKAKKGDFSKVLTLEGLADL